MFYTNARSLSSASTPRAVVYRRAVAHRIKPVLALLLGFCLGYAFAYFLDEGQHNAARR
jgi:hypothetical protein